MKRQLINEVKQLQKIAGLLKEDFNIPNEHTSDIDTVIAKHEGALLSALDARSADPEDREAYYKLLSTLKTIAKELGLNPADHHFMEDENYSGMVSPKEALDYTKDLFTDWMADVKGA